MTSANWYLYSFGQPNLALIARCFTPALRGFVDRVFNECEVAEHLTNAYGVQHEETVEHPDIFVCRSVRVRLQQS